MSTAGPAASWYDQPAQQSDQDSAKVHQPARLRQVGVTESERNYSIAMHLSVPVLSIVAFPVSMLAPLVLWLIRRHHSVFNDDHGREVINVMLSFLLWHVITAITIVGFALWPVLWVVLIVNFIRGAIASGNGEYFRYPMTIRFLA
ncbi:MAG: DUF4870 domain-containing protein [Planctomycetes bacterium]|nr:DUF4870 domain-containing protein [Planctomycetota bacterium]